MQRDSRGVVLGESDTRAKLIDPGLHVRGWTEDLIRREETAGTIQIIDGKPRKQAKGRVDYVLRIKVNPETQPVAVALIEAKKQGLPPTHGLEQAKLYASAKRMNVPFVFSSNGHLFVEYDRFTGLTTDPRPLAQFPSPADLRARYEAAMGFSLEDAAAQPLLMRYVGGEATRRYYQDAAIRAALEKIARCERNGQPKHVLLSLATGAGKTFIAVNLLKRIADAGQLRRALFVCDRDELRSQALGAFQNVFGADAAEVFKEPDGSNHARKARIHIATYQTLDVDNQDGTANFLATFYPENYFSHIVIDECHRSAWGKWSQVLTRNPDAVQVGLTATPRQLQSGTRTREYNADAEVHADNIRHFGEPVYEYDLYDVLAELGYGLNPRTRSDRAGGFAYKHASWLSALPPDAAATLKALASQFARAGTEGLENPEVFQTPEVIRAGGLTALRAIGKPADVLHETKERMFAA